MKQIPIIYIKTINKSPYISLSPYLSICLSMKTRIYANSRNLIIKMCLFRILSSSNIRIKIKIFIAKIKTFVTFGKTHETDVISIRSVLAAE